VPIQLGRLAKDQMLPLLGGTYMAKSELANAQRCVNLYPELNQDDADYPLTMYPVPGLKPLGAPPVVGRARGLYWATNKNIYAIVEQAVYQINQNTWAFTQLGSLTDALHTPVTMVDNGNYVLLLNGTATGYTINMTTGDVAQITDPNFFGGTRAGFLSTFLVNNVPGTQEFQSTLSGQFLYNGLYVASKTGYPDLLATLAVMHLEIWLIGERTTEVWYNAGNANFPFALYPGVFLEHGTPAPWSLAQHDLAVFFLAQDKDGTNTVVKGHDYKLERISTHGIEWMLSQMNTTSDCVADLYAIEGHIFYRMHFISANKTLVYDDRIGMWHEVVYTDANGQENRALDIFATQAFGLNISLDWANGYLYQLDQNTYTDNGSLRVFRRGFPHLTSNGRQIYYAAFKASIDTGTDSLDAVVPQIYLRWSDTKGRSWSNPVGRSLGGPGAYNLEPRWNRCGRGRDRVHELFWSANAKIALNGAWVDALPMGS
jgi:hypothetical protein